MRSFKAQPKFDPSATQPQIYSPSRNNYQNRIMNVTETSKNKNRTQQIVLLHEEFEDLKKKIKEVENKNEKIIEKIHRECNFKKKTPQMVDVSGEGPIVYYEKKQKSQLSQKSGMSVDDSNKSDQSEFEFRQKKPTGQRNSVQSNKHLPQKIFSQSMQYTRSDVKGDQLKKKYSKMSRQKQEYEEEADSRELIEDEFEGEQFPMQQSHQTYHHLKQYTHSGKSSGKKSANVSSYPVSQTHMAYSALNHPPSIPQQFRHSQQLFNPSLTRQQPSRISHPSTTNSSLVIYQLEQSLKIEKQKTAYLQQQLKNKELQILTVKKEYNKLMGQFESVEMIFEDCLEQFFQNTVKKGFFEIDKTLKKYENRLRNMAIHIKDEYEEVKSSRLIKQHQLRRSNSRSRRDLSPIHNTSIHSVIAPPNQSAKIPRPNSSQGSSIIPSSNGSGLMSLPQPQNIQPSQTSLLHQQQQLQLDKRSRISQQSRKNREFEQIVQKYEQMINSKREQVSKLEQLKKQAQKRNQLLEKQLQLKQTQVKEFKQRLQQLDKLMSEMQTQGPIHSRAPKKPYRVSSTESNLLEDIEQYNSGDQEERRYERMYNEMKKQYQEKNQHLEEVNEQMEVYEQKITEYEFKLKEYQTKIRKLQHTSSSQSIAVSQKSETLLKKQLQQSIKQHLNQLHQLQITHKDSQILKLKQALGKVEKKLVEKDCECISLNNRVKKLDGVNELNAKKIEEYEKLLNHYQLNASVDMGEHWAGGSVLDRSICNDIEVQGSMLSTGMDESARKSTQRHSKTPTRASSSVVSIPRNQLQSLETQLKEMSEQILILTKRLKLSEKASSEKELEIQKLQEELEMGKVQVSKYSQLNSELKSKVSELQQQISDMRMREFDRSQQEEGEEFIGEDSGHNNDESQEWSNSHKSQKAERYEQKPPSTHSRPTLHHKRHSDLQPHAQPPHSPGQSRKPSQDHETILQLQQSLQRLQDQLKSLKAKNLELSSQYTNLKSEHLELSRNNITIKKNNEYLQESLADREQKYEKCKREVEEMRVRNGELIQKLHVKEEELVKEKQENCQKINELEKQWHEFEEEITKNNQPEPTLNLLQSDHLKTSRYNLSESSLLLSSTIHNKTSHYLQEQNEYLTIKLKQAEATIEIHNLMEQKVLDEYKANVERLKGEVKEKAKEVEQVRKELEMMSDAKRRLEVLYESSKNYLSESRVDNGANRMRRASEASVKKSQHNQEKKNNLEAQPINQSQSKDLSMQQFPSYNQDANNLSMLSHQNPNSPALNQQQRMYPYQRIIELQGELKQAKDINNKLQEMEEELFKQIRLKQEEKKDLIRLLDEKNLKIQELQEIVELKDNNMLGSSHLGSHILGSHISSSNYKSSSNPKHSAHNLSQRQSLHSHSSLRYSGITHLKTPNITLHNPSSTNLQVMNASQMGTSERFEIELSQTGSQMLDKSYVTNISEIFQKQEFPYEKVQLKRKEQIKLFQKTASYIKSLKQSINEKNKKIKLLQKKIESLKNTHHGPISKQLQNKYEISTRANDNAEDVQLEFESVFKDYESVQLQRKKASHNKRYKNLEHEWKLAIEENNVLSNQVEVLQQQLQKAEEQQNTILVMKDLYKDEIKKLLAKNQQQTAYYEDLLAKQKAKLEQSQSVHNLETIKQLFLKVMDSIIIMESDKSKKKREEKKKDLEQFFKIFASLCAVDEPKKNAILEGIKKMTLNIVLAEEGRGASRGKD